MKRVVGEQRLGVVATVCTDATPNLAARGERHSRGRYGASSERPAARLASLRSWPNIRKTRFACGGSAPGNQFTLRRLHRQQVSKMGRPTSWRQGRPTLMRFYVRCELRSSHQGMQARSGLPVADVQLLHTYRRARGSCGDTGHQGGTARGAGGRRSGDRAPCGPQHGRWGVDFASWEAYNVAGMGPCGRGAEA
jgi:hypothetical protein